MLNLFRMDMRRVIRSKAFYISLGILCLTTIFTFFIMCVMSNPTFHSFFMERGLFSEELGTEQYVEQFIGMSLLEIYHETNIKGGFLPLVSGIIAMILICGDFGSGFIKNILSVHVNKWDYILGKICSLLVVNLILVAMTYVLEVGLNLVTGSSFVNPPAADVLFYLVTAWMINNGLCALIMMLCVITRNVGVGVAGAICFCSGLIVVIANALLGIFKLNGFLKYTLYMNMASCPLTYKGTSDLRGLIVAAVFLVIYTVIAKIVLIKRIFKCFKPVLRLCLGCYGEESHDLCYGNAAIYLSAIADPCGFPA